MKSIVSVIICTYNRCDSLRDTLESLLLQECDSTFKYEIIIVDNNSTDKTRDVVEGYMSKISSPLRYVFEINQGLSYARNRGIREAKGEILAFTDDDVVLDKKWIKAIQEKFTIDGCDLICGKILPLWSSVPPVWLTVKFYACLALLNYGDHPFQIRSKNFQFYGANFAVRKCIFDELGSFNTGLGRKGDQLFTGEDSELFFTLLNRNKHISYYPDVIVHHKINRERIEKSYLKKWQFFAGQSNFIIKKNVTFYFIFQGVIDRALSFIYCFFRRDVENMVYHEIKLFFFFGLLKAKLVNTRPNYAKS